jgi:toxin FitB
LRGWLLDTNVVSELRKERCDPRVRAWAHGQRPASLYLSTVTLAEIRYGIDRVGDFALRVEFEAWLDGTLRPWFAGRILPVDEEVVLRWRHLVDHGRAKGHTFSQPDLFIAATADVHRLVVATRNTRDFAAAEVPTFDPWRDGAGAEPG